MGYWDKSDKDKIKEQVEKFIEKAKDYSLKWTRKAYLKSKYFVEGIDNEIYWLYLGERKGSEIILTDCVLIEQEVSGASCELDGDKLGKWMEDNLDKMTKVVGWGHSHNNMSTFWSATDEEDIARSTNSQPWVSIVFNKPFSYLARIDIPTILGKLPINGLKVQLVMEQDEELKEQCEAEIKAKVEESKSVKITSYKGKSRNRCWDGYGWKEDYQTVLPLQERVDDMYEVGGLFYPNWGR